jgi:hypothetical protein
VGGTRREADAEMAQPLLLDLRVRAQILAGGDYQICQLARRRQNHLRRFFPAGLELSRIFREMDDISFKDEVWPKFLRDNAARVLGINPLR